MHGACSNPSSESGKCTTSGKFPMLVATVHVAEVEDGSNLRAAALAIVGDDPVCENPDGFEGRWLCVEADLAAMLDCAESKLPLELRGFASFVGVVIRSALLILGIPVLHPGCLVCLPPFSVRGCDAPELSVLAHKSPCSPPGLLRICVVRLVSKFSAARICPRIRPFSSCAPRRSR
jgi:hypothetical protein